ncbi:MAG: hypothetical protein Q4G59_01250, partial [Planctomycetia bacterium]|nr:hypothetical protein [Planctomycetia bacterium]
MALELVYTSAPQGIKSGTRGFCTVACTRGIPAPMAATLESLSAYRHIYPPQDPNARLNPVNYSHLYLVSGGIPLHILSRIADAGLDYSQRTNKIAHHFVLSSKDLVSGGPAPLFTMPGLFRDRWNEEPLFFPNQRELYGSTRSPGVCRRWEELLGDPGWGGVLAASVELQRPVCLVFRPGQNLLPLFDEAIALLPEKERWNATFSTYYTRIPPGIQCLWKAVVQNTIDEGVVRAIPGTVTVDLTMPCQVPLDLVKEPKAAFYVKLAREGVRDSSPSRPKPFEQNESVPGGFDGLDSLAVPITTVAIPEIRPQDELVPPQWQGGYDLDSPENMALLLDHMEYGKTEREKSFWLPFFVILAGLVMCFVMVGVVWYLVLQMQSDLTPDSAEKNPAA